jgi:hypothetical protein
MPSRISDQYLGWIKAHRLVVEQSAIELGWKMGLEVQGLVGYEGKSSSMGLAKAESCKACQLLPYLLGRRLVHAVALRPEQESLSQGRHRLL